MPNSVKELLKWEGMTALYSESDYNLQTPLTDRFFTNPTPVDSDEYEMLIDPNDTRPAPTNRKDSAARVLDGVGLTERRGVLIRTFNAQSFGQDVMSAIREAKSRELDRKGKAEIVRQSAKFRTRHALLKELLIAKVLGTGVLYYDRATGLIAESSGSGVQTIDFGVDATHKTDLNSLSLLGTSFASAGFDLIGLFDYIDNKAVTENSEPITEVHCDISLKQYLLKNTQFQTWAAKGTPVTDEVLSGQYTGRMTIPGVFGKNFHFYGGSYTNASGTVTRYLPTTKMIFTPSESSRTWYEPSEGLSLIPTSADVTASLESAVDSLAEVYGPFAYAEVARNPLRVDHFAGDCFGFNLKTPQSVFMPTVII